MPNVHNIFLGRTQHHITKKEECETAKKYLQSQIVDEFHFAFATRTKRKEIYSFRKTTTACVLSETKKLIRARFIYMHISILNKKQREADRNCFLLAFLLSAFLSTRRKGRIEITERVELH